MAVTAFRENRTFGVQFHSTSKLVLVQHKFDGKMDKCKAD